MTNNATSNRNNSNQRDDKYVKYFYDKMTILNLVLYVTLILISSVGKDHISQN